MLQKGKNDFQLSKHEVQHYKFNTKKFWFWHSGVSPTLLIRTKKLQTLKRKQNQRDCGEESKMGEVTHMGACFSVSPPHMWLCNQGRTHLQSITGSLNSNRIYTFLAREMRKSDPYRLESMYVGGGGWRRIMKKRQGKKGPYNFVYESTQVTAQPELCMYGIYPNQLL